MRRLAVLLVLALSSLLPSQLHWADVSDSAAVGTRFFGMAYDTVNHGILRFGGSNDPGATWLWKDDKWTRLSPATSPPPRTFATLCTDSLNQQVLLFGGREANRRLNDTWAWNGTTWREVWTANQPSPRDAHAMVYDSRRNRVLLFGGSQNPSAELLDTWQWAGSRWTQLPVQFAPPARMGHAMAYDPKRDRVVLYGGWGAGRHLTDTWEFDGTSWEERETTFDPRGQVRHAMAYDAVREVTVLTGGSDFDWTGDYWTHTLALGDLPGRDSHGMVWYPDSHRMVLFGGYDGDLRSDTWTLVNAYPAQYYTLGVGCAGTVGTPELVLLPDHLPWISDAITARIGSIPSSVLSQPFGILGFSNTTWDSIPLPLDLAVIGMPDCLLQVSIDHVVPLTNTGGAAFWSLQIPDDPSLAGAEFFQQALVLDSGVNALGATVSNAGRAVIGFR